MKTILTAIDAETTGLTAEDKIIEIGICSVTFEDGTIEIGHPSSELVNPHRPISVEAMAACHITDEMAATGTDLDSALNWALTSADIVVAHNSRFEQQFIKTDKHWIDTYRVALHLAPHAPGHSLQVLRYWLKLNIDPVLASPPHRAAPDAYCCAALLARMLAKISIAEMIEISSRPALLPKFRFGKHADLPLADVPKSYLEWILTQEFDEDVKFTASYYLKSLPWSVD